MKRFRASIIALALVAAACTEAPVEPTAGVSVDPPPSPLPSPQVEFPDGFVVDLELALTPEEITNGLMFRPSLAENRGMLFIFEEPRSPSFWMKNTLIPLDLVFLDESGTVVDVIANVPPCGTDPCPTYPSSKPAKAALEVGAGVAAAHGLETGAVMHFDRVPDYPTIASQPHEE